MPVALDTLTGEDRDVLHEYARRLLPFKDDIGSAWADAWLKALPARDVDPDAYRQVVDFLARESVGTVLDFILNQDFEGLYRWQYENNREGARRQLGDGAVLVFNQHELHLAARAGHPIVYGWIDRAFGEDRLIAERVKLAQEKLGSILNTILSEAYSDEREGHLKALDDQHRRALDVSERLRQVGQAITQSLEIEPVLDLALQTAAELLQADCAGYTMASHDTRSHRLARLYGADISKFPTAWSPIEGSLTGWVYENNQVARSGRKAPLLSERALTTIKALGVESYVVAPLRARGRPLGTLGVYRRTPRPFTRDDESILQRLSDTLAIAIENARVYAEARQALAAAEQANREKSEFIAAVSHEIRAPLSSILGYVDLLRENNFGEVRSEQLDIFERLDLITRSTLRLSNDLLDHARLQAGGLPVHMAIVSVAPLLDGISESLRLILGGRPVQVIARLSTTARDVHADPDRLRQILINLTSNAAKFTARGQIELDVLHAAGDGWTSFVVRDTGCGIAATDLPRIFELFYRADPKSSSGAGIGLFLSRQLAQAMGGELRVESQIGRGTAFTLTLKAAGA